MKIALLNTLDGDGGTARVARLLLDQLRQRGHEVALIVSRKVSKDSGIFEMPMLFDGTALERAGRFFIGLAARVPSQSPAARNYWRRLVQTCNPASRLNLFLGREDFALPRSRRVFDALPFDPEIINLHNLHCFNGLTHFDLRALPALARQRKTVVTLNDPWLLTGHCAHPFTCERWRLGCGSCPDLPMYPTVRRDATAFNLARKAEVFAQIDYHMAGPSRWIIDMANASRLGSSLRGAHVIPNGVDTSFFRPPEDRARARHQAGLAPEERAVAYIADLGRGSPFRDYVFNERLVRAYAETPGNPPLVLFEVGGKPSDIKTGNIRIVGTGPLKSEGVRSILQASDALLHPAKGDTYPTVILEAMACGTPAVATNVSGIPEQITDGIDGFLHEPGDLARALAGLQTLCERGHAADALRTAARKRAETHFGEKAFVDGYEQLFTSLLSR